jgi:hypothetical protein
MDALAPKVFDNLFPSYQFTLPRSEQNQQFHRQPFQPQRPAVSTDFIAPDVELRVVEPKDLTGHSAAPQGGADYYITQNTLISIDLRVYAKLIWNTCRIH